MENIIENIIGKSVEQLLASISYEPEERKRNLIAVVDGDNADEAMQLLFKLEGLANFRAQLKRELSRVNKASFQFEENREAKIRTISEQITEISEWLDNYQSTGRLEAISPKIIALEDFCTGNDVDVGAVKFQIPSEIEITNSINYQAWALHENLNVFEAASLWGDRNPHFLNQWNEIDYIEVRDLILNLLRHQFDAENYPAEKRNIVIMLLAQRFDSDTSVNRLLQEGRPFVFSRTQLKAIALKVGGNPRFLFEIDETQNDYSIIKTEVGIQNKESNLTDYVSQSIDDGLSKTAIKPESTKTKKPKNEVNPSPIFAQFENLHANEISLVVLEDHSVNLFIRKKKIKANPHQLGLKHGLQNWKLFEGSAVNKGNMESTLKKLNSSTDLEAEKGKISTVISRLNKSIKSAMGLVDVPIICLGGSYKFIFKTMTHACINNGYISKGADAMDYLDGNEFDNNKQRSNKNYSEEDEDTDNGVSGFWRED